MRNPIDTQRPLNPPLLIFLLLFLLLFSSIGMAVEGDGEQQPEGDPAGLPMVRIGVVTDGPLISQPRLVKIFQEEILSALDGEFAISFPKSMTLQADSTNRGVKRQLDALLNNPQTDLILTLGIVASAEALSRTQLAKPVVAPFVLQSEFHEIPKEQIGSGVTNLAYIDIGASIDREVIAFRKLVPFDSLAMLIDERDIDGIPHLKKLANYLANEHSIKVHLLPVGSSASEVIAALPGDIEAVMVGPLWQISDKDFSLLSDEFIRRQIPSFALTRYEYLEMGLFATTAPEKMLDHLARQASITVQEILYGEAPSNLPIYFSRTQKLAINMDTARAINVYPSLDYMTGARLINERRQDISRRVNLFEVVNEALAVNLDLIMAEKEVSAGSYAVGEARSTLLPQISIGAGGRAIDDDRATASRGMTPENALIGSASLYQQIYSESGWAAYAVEKYRQQGREFNRDTVRLDIMYQSGVSYFDVLRLETIERLQKENMGLTLANLERAQIRLSTGVAGPDEVYRWQTQFANDRQIVLKAESDTIDARQALNRILDRPLLEEFVAEETDLSDPLLIVGNSLFYELIHNPLYLKRFNVYAVQLGLKESPELGIVDSALGAQERTLLEARREYWLPTFSVEGNVDQLLTTSGAGQRDDSLDSIDDTDWTVGIYARLPLFEGGRKSAAVGRNREQILRLKTQERNIEEQISQRILRALNNTRASYPSINLSRDAADAAGRNLQLVTDSYVQGIKSIIDLIDAQNQALNADLAAANAVYNFLIDLMGVQRSIGEFVIFLPSQEQQQWLDEAKAYIQQK